MTDILFEYDHILIRSEYRTPDIHKHLAAHIVFGINDELTCIVGTDTFKCRGVFITSDREHTIYAETGDMLLFLLDTTSDMARIVDENYLHGNDYAMMEKATVDMMVRLPARECSVYRFRNLSKVSIYLKVGYETSCYYEIIMNGRFFKWKNMM